MVWGKGLDEAERAVKVIRQAARLNAAELRNMECSMTHYPDMDDLSHGGDAVVPHLWQLLVGELVRDARKQAAISQALVQAAKPCSCITPLVFALGVDIHRKHASADLVKQLSRKGFCISLDKVYRYLQSVMQTAHTWQSSEYHEASFTQFVADNVDHNIRTVDGIGTFHGMGMIVTSSFYEGNPSKVTRRILHLRHHTKAATVCRDTHVPLIPYTGQAGAGLIDFRLKGIELLQQAVCLPTTDHLTTLWHAAAAGGIYEGHRPLWGIFMTSIYEGEHPPPASIPTPANSV